MNPKERTTVYLTNNVVAFLRARHRNISSVCDAAMLKEALRLGYGDLDQEIKKKEQELRKLRKVKKDSREADSTRQAFYDLMKLYLNQGQPKDIPAIRQWLKSLTCKPYLWIIGNPNELTDQQIATLILEALDLAPSESEVLL